MKPAQKRQNNHFGSVPIKELKKFARKILNDPSIDLQGDFWEAFNQNIDVNLFQDDETEKYNALAYLVNDDLSTNINNFIRLF